MEPEVVMNLWVFIQSIGPMHVIYELGVRPYMMTGSDDEMTRLLKELAVSEFHFARRFALPDRYLLTFDTTDVGGGRQSRKGLTGVDPMISGMHQMEYFKEALDALEKSLPTRRLGIDGVETTMPKVNRKNLLSVITNINVDSQGNQIPLLAGDPRRHASPSAVANLWMFHDEKAKAIYAISGRGYMVHGSDGDKSRILKAFAPYDFSLAPALPIPEEFSASVDGKTRKGVLPVSFDSKYSRDLFNGVFQAIEREIPTAIGLDGKMKNRVTISASQSMSIANRITERSSNVGDASLIQVVEAPRPNPAKVQTADVPRPAPSKIQVAEAPRPSTAKVQTVKPFRPIPAKKSFFQRIFGK